MSSRAVRFQSWRFHEETVKLGRRSFEDNEGTLPREVPEELVGAILAARRQ